MREAMKAAGFKQATACAAPRRRHCLRKRLATGLMAMGLTASVIYSPAGHTQAPTDRSLPQAIAKGRGLTNASVKNCHYKSDQHDGIIKLKDGKAEGKFPGSTIFGWQCRIEKVALGDLDGDGSGDAVMAIGYNGGGSGYFVDLVAMMNRGGKPVQGATTSLGDRVIVKDLRLNKGKVTLLLLEHGADDSLAETSLRKVRAFRLNKAAWQKLK